MVNCLPQQVLPYLDLFLHRFITRVRRTDVCNSVFYRTAQQRSAATVSEVRTSVGLIGLGFLIRKWMLHTPFSYAEVVHRAETTSSISGQHDPTANEGAMHNFHLMQKGKQVVGRIRRMQASERATVSHVTSQRANMLHLQGMIGIFRKPQ